MKKKILFFSLAVNFWCFALNAQVTSSDVNSKLNLSLQNLIKESVSLSSSAKIFQRISYSQTPTPSTEIAVFVKGDIGEIKRKTEEVGGTFKYSAGDIAAIRIPLGKITELAALPSVRRIENN